MGIILYYYSAVDPNMLATVYILSADQSNMNQSNTQKVVKLLNYESTQ